MKKTAAKAPVPIPAPPNLPGLAIKYNHDLNPVEEFLSAYPEIRNGLKDVRLLETFSHFDAIAQAHKSSFERLGLISLILGVTPLAMAAVHLTVGEDVFSKVANVNVATELCGVLSVGVILWCRLRRHRVLWCQAVFCRERLRQWHFQKFLDGSLMSLLPNQKLLYQQELDRRWGELLQNLKDGYGMMVEFLRAASHSNDFFHRLTPYENGHVAQEVFEALWTLRFEHQLRYSRRKLEPEGQQSGLALEEREAFSESVASVTLVGAIVMSALSFAVSIAHIFGAFANLPVGPETITRSFAGTALLLAVLSAASRAYRAGFTLPDESESYEEYCDRVRELRAVFKRVTEDNEKLSELGHLEEEAAGELRRFLRMKTRATFVF
jgi:hypothetical protein